MILDMFKELED